MLRTSFATAFALALMATAASADSLQVTYTVQGGIAAVPTLTEWAMIGLGLALAGFAVITLRRKGRFGGVALGLAALVSASAIGIPSARAVDYRLEVTGPGPALQVLQNGGNHTVTIVNRSGGTLTVTNTVVVNGSRYAVLGIPFQGSCSVSPVLAPNGECAVPLIDRSGS